MFELGCSTLSFARMSLQEALEEIKSQGFNIIDLGALRPFKVGENPFKALHFDPLVATKNEKVNLKKALKELKLKVATLNVGAGYLNIPWERSIQIKYTKCAMEFAAEIGAYAVTIQSGKLLRGTDWDKNVEYVIPAFKELAEFGEKLGVELTIEGPHIEMLTSSSSETSKFIKITDHPNFGTTYDPSHVAYFEKDAVESVYELKDVIKHIHLRDGMRDNPVLPPGEGDINWKEFFKALKDIGYNRPVILELCQGEDMEYENSCALFKKQVKESSTFLKKILKELS